MAKLDLDRAVRDVRRFNRFYTKHIGVLRERFTDSPFSLAEAATRGPTRSSVD